MQDLLVYIPMDRRQALWNGHSLDGKITGSALFADISGFTPLTEKLARSLGPQRGAEELAGYLNLVYDELTNTLHKYGGSVLGFSGDAITCWFNDDQGARATTCALEMQQAMSRFEYIQMPDGDSTGLAMKAAVAAGSAKRFVIGDPDIMLTDVIAGSIMDNLAAAEHHAHKGEVVLEESAANNLRNLISIDDVRCDDDSGSNFYVINAINEKAETQTWFDLSKKEFDIKKIQPWVHEPVFKRLEENRGDFLAELRPAVALFLKFSGIDFENDDHCGEKLNQYIKQVQAVLAKYEGTLVQLTIGDKGSYLYAAFGAPFAHEDDTVRAATTAIELRQLGYELDFISSSRIGISKGRMRTGAYGGSNRRTYGVLGDDTNLSARLMSAAGEDTILVSSKVQAELKDIFELREQEPIQLKGKSEPTTPYQLERQRSGQNIDINSTITGTSLVGRKKEIKLLQEKIELTIKNRGQVLGIKGEAGLGKSRLAAEAVKFADQKDMLVFTGECQSFGANIPYQVWQPVWRQFFGISRELDQQEAIQELEAQIIEQNPGLLSRIPLLSPVLGIQIPDNDLTRNFDAKLRKSSLESLLVDLLRSKSRNNPVLIFLDDCQWLDPLSYDLAEVLSKANADMAVLIILTYRSLDSEKSSQPRIRSLAHFHEIGLNEFAPEEAQILIADRLSSISNYCRDVSPSIVETISKRTGGNPFYIEELVNYLKEEEICTDDENALDGIQLPTSLHSLILSRIDQRTESQKSTLKLASVIGRTFSASWLWEAFPEHIQESQVREDLEVLDQMQLTLQDQPDPELTYIFKHPVIQEVSYENLPFNTRSGFHNQVGLFIENCCHDSHDRYLDLLAFHFDRSENRPKKCEYLLKAGEHAREKYANEAAIDYYQKVIGFLPLHEQIDVLLKLGDIFVVKGEWEKADEQYELALLYSKKTSDSNSLAWTRVKKADLLGRQGKYDEASTWLESSRNTFSEIGDDEGMAFVLKLAGTQAAQKGEFDKAKKLFRNSLDIYRKSSDQPNIANILNNLAIVDRVRGSHQDSLDKNMDALSIRRETGDKWAIANSLNNIGVLYLDMKEFDNARLYLEEALTIQRELGDRFHIANTLNNLANVYRDTGEFDKARNLYMEGLEINQELSAKWAIAYLLEDIGALAAMQDQPYKALQLIFAASELRTEIGSKRSDSESERIRNLINDCEIKLPAAEQVTARESGQSMSIQEAVSYAMKEEAENSVELIA